MPSLTYPATFGHQTKTVRIDEIQGDFQVYVDNYYQGQVVREQGKLVMHPARRGQLTGDDMAAILEVVEREFVRKE